MNFSTISSTAPEAKALAEIDEALSAPIETDAHTADDSTNRVSKLAKVLRSTALVVLFSSAATFLFQGWIGWDSVERVLVFLAFIAALAATGLLCALKFTDDKSARISLGVATAIIPVAFSQIGALLYSLHVPRMSKIPAFFLYTAPSTTSVMLLLTLGLLILSPVAFAGFSVLARPAARALTACYLVANLALLIPTRDPNYIAVISFIMMSALMYFDHRHLRDKSELRTIEGMLSRFMQYVPFGILLARNLSLHAASSLLNSSIFALIAVFLFCVVPAVTQRRGLAGFVQGLSLIPASISWGAACEGLFFSTEALLKLPNGYTIAIFALPIALLMVVMSFFTVSTGTSYRHAASVLAMFAMTSQLASMPGVVSSFLLIATGIVCMIAAYMLEEKLHLYMGGFGLLIGLLFHVKYAMRLYYGLGPWLSLAILGVGTLLLAAYLEKNHRYVLAQFGKLRLKLSDWR